VRPPPLDVGFVPEPPWARVIFCPPGSFPMVVFVPGARSGGGSSILFILLLCVGANRRFLVQVRGEPWVLVVSCRDVVKARSTRLG